MTTLVDLLRARGCLLEGEDAMLLAPDARDLPPRVQLKYLSDNRRVGRVVTAFAGGVRLLFLAGGALAMIGAVLDGEMPIAWWSIAIWIALVAVVGWLTPRFFARLRELGRPLPAWSELEREFAPGA